MCLQCRPSCQASCTSSLRPHALVAYGLTSELVRPLQAVAHAVLYPEDEEADAAQNYAAMLLPPPAIPAIPAAKQRSTEEVAGNTSPTFVGPAPSRVAAQEDEEGGQGVCVGGGIQPPIQPPIAGPPLLPLLDNASENWVISAPGPGMASEKDTDASGSHSEAVGEQVVQAVEEVEQAASTEKLQQGGDSGEGAA